MIISVEANIGSGKTTMLNILRNKYKNIENIVFVDEPLNSWLELKDDDGENILKKFYKDQKRWSYSFQMNAFITRAKSIMAADPKKNLIIVERSVLTDRNVFASLLYESGKISKMEWDLYNEWFIWLLNDYNIKPDLYVYLNATAETSFSRMKLRARTEEEIVPKEYIEAVGEKHNKWLLNEEKALILDVNNDFENDIDFRNNILKILDDVIINNLNTLDK